LTKKKNKIINELQNSMAFRSQKIEETYSNVLKQIQNLTESWEIINNFNSKITKLSYEEFSKIRNVNQKGLYQAE
jgi:fructose-1,6-bisphosphatase